MAQRRRPKKQAKQPRQVQGRRARRERRERREGSFVFGHRNALLMVAGMVIIVLGYFLLGRGSITAAPLLLVAGYCVAVPLAIVLWSKQPEDKQHTGLGE